MRVTPIGSDGRYFDIIIDTTDILSINAVLILKKCIKGINTMTTPIFSVY